MAAKDLLAKNIFLGLEINENGTFSLSPHRATKNFFIKKVGVLYLLCIVPFISSPFIYLRFSYNTMVFQYAGTRFSLGAASSSRFLQRGSAMLKRHLGSSSTSNSTSSDNNNTTNNKALDMAYGPVNAFQMNQYAIACTETKQAAFIDCGASTQQELDAFLKWIQDKNYQLKAVWQTHAHLDHVAGLGLLVFQNNNIHNVPIYLHQKEREIYNSFEQRCQDFGFAVEGDGKLPEDTTLEYFDDTTKSMTLGNLTFDIIPTPGHSPGHVGFFEPQSKSFFGGDFIMQGSIGRTDFPTSNPHDMKKSLQHFVDTMHDETVIYPGHGAPTMLQQEKQYNPFLQDLK